MQRAVMPLCVFSLDLDQLVVGAFYCAWTIGGSIIEDSILLSVLLSGFDNGTRKNTCEVRDPVWLHAILQSNIGHATLSQAKGTPAYLKAVQTNLFTLLKTQG